MLISLLAFIVKQRVVESNSIVQDVEVIDVWQILWERVNLGSVSKVKRI